MVFRSALDVLTLGILRVMWNTACETCGRYMIVLSVMCHGESSAREARAKILVYIYVYIWVQIYVFMYICICVYVYMCIYI